MNELQSLLKSRFDVIEKRIGLVLNQLDDQQVNWRLNKSSNRISNLIFHMSGKARMVLDENYITTTIPKRRSSV